MKSATLCKASNRYGHMTLWQRHAAILTNFELTLRLSFKPRSYHPQPHLCTRIIHHKYHTQLCSISVSDSTIRRLTPWSQSSVVCLNLSDSGMV